MEPLRLNADRQDRRVVRASRLLCERNEWNYRHRASAPRHYPKNGGERLAHGLEKLMAEDLAVKTGSTGEVVVGAAGELRVSASRLQGKADATRRPATGVSVSELTLKEARTERSAPRRASVVK